jgi:hypothetical protein
MSRALHDAAPALCDLLHRPPSPGWFGLNSCAPGTDTSKVKPAQQEPASAPPVSLMSNHGCEMSAIASKERVMSEQFTYQISDLDHIVTDAGYAYTELGDIEEVAEQLQAMLLTEHPALNNMGLVLVIGDSAGRPLLMRPLGVIH